MWLVDAINMIKPSVKKIKPCLSIEDHLFIILMKLRLGLTSRDLALRFEVSTSIISKILRNWLPILGNILKKLNVWPSKAATKKHMPKVFRRTFRNCRCIIDCSEFFIERPSNLTARAQTWSNYKHHNTIKYLIGITPAGTISFLSDGWGGRVSDKEITLSSTFLDKLEPNDVILADRGFLISEEVAMRGAILKIPSFTKGKKQLSGSEVDQSRQLARVRIHVERVIGRLKNFKILQTVIPLSLVELLDSVMITCAALTNLAPSVVPKNRK